MCRAIKMIKTKQKTKFIKLLLLICYVLIIQNVWSQGVNHSINNSTAITKAITKTQLGLTKIEFAKTAEQKAYGLMNRKSLCQECAMLFVYDQLSTDAFWMRNTFISLDIIFIDEDGQVVAIHNNTQPLNTSKLYHSPVKYKYALETNSGFAQQKNIKLHTKLDMPSLLTIN